MFGVKKLSIGALVTAAIVGSNVSCQSKRSAPANPEKLNKAPNSEGKEIRSGVVSSDSFKAAQSTGIVSTSDNPMVMTSSNDSAGSTQGGAGDSLKSLDKRARIDSETTKRKVKDLIPDIVSLSNGELIISDKSAIWNALNSENFGKVREIFFGDRALGPNQNIPFHSNGALQVVSFDGWIIDFKCENHFQSGNPSDFQVPVYLLRVLGQEVRVVLYYSLYTLRIKKRRIDILYGARKI